MTVIYDTFSNEPPPKADYQAMDLDLLLALALHDNAQAIAEVKRRVAEAEPHG